MAFVGRWPGRRYYCGDTSQWRIVRGSWCASRWPIRMQWRSARDLWRASRRPIRIARAARPRRPRRRPTSRRTSRSRIARWLPTGCTRVCATTSLLRSPARAPPTAATPSSSSSRTARRGSSAARPTCCASTRAATRSAAATRRASRRATTRDGRESRVAARKDLSLARRKKAVSRRRGVARRHCVRTGSGVGERSVGRLATQRPRVRPRRAARRPPPPRRPLVRGDRAAHPRRAARARAARGRGAAHAHARRDRAGVAARRRGRRAAARAPGPNQTKCIGVINPLQIHRWSRDDVSFRELPEQPLRVTVLAARHARTRAASSSAPCASSEPPPSSPPSFSLFVAAERVPLLRARAPCASSEPSTSPPPSSQCRRRRLRRDYSHFYRPTHFIKLGCPYVNNC